MDRIKLEDLVARRVYKLHCRNLKFGVYDGKGTFSGIREKWGSRYLCMEYHWDDGDHGTVSGMLDTGIDLPEGVDPSARDRGSVDDVTGRDVDFVEINGNFVWAFSDTGRTDPRIRPVSKGNMALKEFMEMIEEQAKNV